MSMPKMPEGRECVQHVFTATEKVCRACRRRLRVVQRRGRHVQSFDELHLLVMRDKRCRGRDCPGYRVIYRPAEELAFALKKDIFGLDVVLEIGELRLRQSLSFREIHRRLVDRGLPIAERTVGDIFERFLALMDCRNAESAEVRERLRAQGGMIVLIDGVQFDEHSPVLYVVTDVTSHTTLFAERHAIRSAEALRPLLERLKAMEVPIVAFVTDKETGLVPAIHAVFPDVPHQFCQLHFIKRCAEPLEKPLTQLGSEVARAAEKLRELRRKLGSDAPKPAPSPAEREVAGELLLAAHAASKVAGRAPFDPTALKRHVRLLAVGEAAASAAKKKGGPGPSSIGSPGR